MLNAARCALVLVDERTVVGKYVLEGLLLVLGGMGESDTDKVAFDDQFVGLLVVGLFIFIGENICVEIRLHGGRDAGHQGIDPRADSDEAQNLVV